MAYFGLGRGMGKGGRAPPLHQARNPPPTYDCLDSTLQQGSTHALGEHRPYPEKARGGKADPVGVWERGVDRVNQPPKKGNLTPLLFICMFSGSTARQPTVCRKIYSAVSKDIPNRVERHTAYKKTEPHRTHAQYATSHPEGGNPTKIKTKY